MGVDPAEFWNSEQSRGDDLAIGDDDDGVGIGFAEELFGFGSADFFWLADGEVGSKSGLFYRGEGCLLAASAGAVGLGNDRDEFEVALLKEKLESRDRELRSAAEK